MKTVRFCLLLLVFFSGAKADAQNDSLMPNLSGEYLVRCYSGDPGWEAYSYWSYQFTNPNPEFDTVFITQYGQNLIAKIYMDSLKVYLKRLDFINDCYVGWSDDEFTGEWQLLYDFGLSVGDTAYGISVGYSIVTSIEDISVQGQNRKKFNCDSGDSFIQGIGSVSHPLMPLLYIFEVGYTVCESTLYYTGPSPIDSLIFSPNCDGQILSEIYRKKESFRIFPNPSDGSYRIEGTGNLQVESVNVFTAIGSKINTQSRILSGDDHVQLNLTGLPSGIYFLQMITTAGDFASRLVLLEK